MTCATSCSMPLLPHPDASGGVRGHRDDLISILGGRVASRGAVGASERCGLDAVIELPVGILLTGLGEVVVWRVPPVNKGAGIANNGETVGNWCNPTNRFIAHFHGNEIDRRFTPDPAGFA